MSYWLVVSIMVCAALAVVLVIVWSLRPLPRRTATPRWVALGSSGIIPQERRANWAGFLHDRVSDAEVIDLTAPGSRITDVRHNQLGPALAAQPVSVVLWVGAEDLLSGVSLWSFRQDLSFVLDQLTRARCHVIVVELPSVEPTETIRQGGPLRRPIHALVEEWAEALQDVAQMYRVQFLTIRDAHGARPAPTVLTSHGARFSPQSLQHIAHQVLPELQRSLDTAAPDWTPDEPWNQPQDPMQRREIGLPTL